MKNWMKLGIGVSILMVLALSASGCVTTTTPTATPTTSSAQPTIDVVSPTPTAVPHKVTPTPPAKKDTSIDSDVQAVVNGMRDDKGYAIIVPLAYKTTDSYGNKVFTVTFQKGYTFVTTIVKSDTSTATAEYNSYVSAAKASGFSGAPDSLDGYSATWMGTQGSGDGTTLVMVGLLSSPTWVIQMVETM